jgi:FixJ family two-component response regulator
MIHVVDDDPSVTRGLKRLLNSWGMRVRTFSSGEEFLSALGRSPAADCAVIDLKMPGMSGLEVQGHMVRIGSDLPVIFMTAHEAEGVEEAALKSGAAGFLRKPFMDQALVDLIRCAIRHRCEAREHGLRHEKSGTGRERPIDADE